MHTTTARQGLPALLVAAAALILLGWIAGRDATATRTAAVAPPASVAVVRLDPLLQGLDERTALETQLTAFIADRQAQLEELVETRDSAVADLEILRPGTAPHRDKTREVLEIRSQLETRQKVLQEIISLETGRILAELFDKIRAASSEIAERQGYDVVMLDDSAARLPPNVSESAVLRYIGERRILHAGASIDITDQVRTYMNNAFQTGGN